MNRSDSTVNRHAVTTRPAPTTATIIFFLPLLLCCGCGPDRDNDGGSTVFVDIEPTAYFAERICGDRFDIAVLVGAGQDPHTFESTPKQVKAVRQARALIHLDLPFERSIVAKLADRGPRIVNAAAGVERIAGGCDHAHGGHDHAPDQPDPHVWLSPRIAQHIVKNICDAFCALDPAGRETYEENTETLQADLRELDNTLGTILAPCTGTRFYVFHPAFGYLAHDYGLEQVAVEQRGGSPGARHVKQLVAEAKKDGVRAVFVQSRFPRKAAAGIADHIGADVVRLDPLAKDYIENMEAIARALADECSRRKGDADER